MKIKVQPEEQRDGTFGEFMLDDPQFYNLMRLAFGIEEGEDIDEIDILDDRIVAYFKYEADE